MKTFKGIKVHRLNDAKIPKRYCDDLEYDSEELDDYDLEKIPVGIEEVWYWYMTGNYCGAGQMILLGKDGKYYIHDMGHCSCYGPTDEIETLGGIESLAELKMTDEADDEIAPLVKMVKRKYAQKGG